MVTIALVNVAMVTKGRLGEGVSKGHGHAQGGGEEGGGGGGGEGGTKVGVGGGRGNLSVTPRRGNLIGRFALVGDGSRGPRFD